MSNYVTLRWATKKAVARDLPGNIVAVCKYAGSIFNEGKSGRTERGLKVVFTTATNWNIYFNGVSVENSRDASISTNHFFDWVGTVPTSGTYCFSEGEDAFEKTNEFEVGIPTNGSPLSCVNDDKCLEHIYPEKDFVRIGTVLGDSDECKVFNYDFYSGSKVGNLILAIASGMCKSICPIQDKEIYDLYPIYVPNASPDEDEEEGVPSLSFGNGDDFDISDILIGASVLRDGSTNGGTYATATGYASKHYGKAYNTLGVDYVSPNYDVYLMGKLIQIGPMANSNWITGDGTNDASSFSGGDNDADILFCLDDLTFNLGDSDSDIKVGEELVVGTNCASGANDLLVSYGIKSFTLEDYINII